MDRSRETCKNGASKIESWDLGSILKYFGAHAIGCSGILSVRTNES
jgi:hypothetical protein